MKFPGSCDIVGFGKNGVEITYFQTMAILSVYIHGTRSLSGKYIFSGIALHGDPIVSIRG